MFTWIIAGWGVGMIGYILLNKADKYNNLHFYDVKRKVQRFKRTKEDVTGSKNKGSLF
jgi:hypothetical protein